MGSKTYRQIMAGFMKSNAELLDAIGPDFDNVDEWTILDHHNSIPGDWKAIGEYLWLIQHGIIPKESKLALGVISGRLINGEVVNRLPVKIAILPNNEMRVLESSVNRDILRAEIAATGTSPFRGKILELTITERLVEVPQDLVPENFKKCKECGRLFEKEGRRVFCSEPCRARFHSRKSMRKRRAEARAAKE